MLEKHQPDLVLCTHFLLAEIISWLKAKGRLACPQAIVVTDLDVHAMWLCHHFEHYFVAIDETREHLVRLGIPGGKVTASGIPIDPVFAEAKDKRAMRQKLGLLADRTIVLLSAGGFGVGPIEHAVASLLELRHPAQVVVVCGRNEELRQRLRAGPPRRARGANTPAPSRHPTPPAAGTSAAGHPRREHGRAPDPQAVAP